MKVVVGLGNPGARYEATRHNVGWWLVDHVARAWGFPPFRKERKGEVTGGSWEGISFLLLKPTTYMNRSGEALGLLAGLPEFQVEEDLLVVVDDAALEVGRIRFRPRGSDGGHKGLRSVSEALGTEGYARLRIGVGVPPPGEDLSEWVLSPMPPEDEEVILGLLPRLAEGVGVWASRGVEAAMNGFNC